jgi:hypothetical protein
MLKWKLVMNVYKAAFAGIAIAFSLIVSTSEMLADKGYAKYAYFIGLAIFIGFATINFYSEKFFSGIIQFSPARIWPRYLFFLWACINLAIVFFFDGANSQQTQVGSPVSIARGAVSFMLSWYGFAIIFSSFFMGKNVASFVYNPFLWLINIYKK